MIRMSQLFSQTRREAPSELKHPGQQYLVRAGYLQMLGGASTGLLPLGLASLNQLEMRFRAKLSNLTPQEISLPLVQPGELWEGTALPIDNFNMPHRQNLALASHYLPALLEVLHTQIRSYRQLPSLLIQAGTRWQNGPRSGSSLWRSRQVNTLELFSLNPDAVSLNESAETIQSILDNFLESLKLPLRQIEDNFYLEGSGNHSDRAWWCEIHGGESPILTCPACDYAASETAAQFQREHNQNVLPLPLKKVATPECPTIESLAQFLNIPASQTAKAVFLVADANTRNEHLVFAVVRGDREVNQIKLMQSLGVHSLRPAENHEIEAVGAIPGYASPVGIENVTVIVDTEIPSSPNLVSGANLAGYHLLNVNYGRDYAAAKAADIAAAKAGYPCPHCGKPLEERKGVILASAFQTDPKFMSAHNCTYMQNNGKPGPIQVGIFSLNLSHLLACIAEAHHDGFGLKLPFAAAPCQVHLTLLNSKTGKPEAAAEELIAQVEKEGFSVLYDDRSERTGVKFNDADLIGLPIRITASERALQQGGFEFKARDSKEKSIVPVEQIISRINAELR